ncbi:MAG: flagellin [Deltaproteobacteria bacterium]|nr:MAG: flagellin [Deltaproteobacteria bacterium]
MGLRIQHNIAALNAHRHLLVSDAGLSKSLERLSSGFRINRAADDAAGMAISSGFRADIASYKVASRNTAEANSLLQVAEGAFDQVSAMLVRLKELATQAASANAGSNLDKLNAEANALIDEIDRIAQVTEYAGTKLINGTFGVGVSGGSTATASTGVTTAQGMIAQETYNLSYAAGSGGVDVTVTTGDGSWTISDVAIPDAGQKTQVTFSAFGLTVTFNENLTSTLAAATIIGTDTGYATFQVGSESGPENRISLSLGDVTTGASGLNIAKDQLDNAIEAQAFLTTINTAISTLNDRRGDIGALQNRLGYAAANLTATIENVTASESVIRDVDMALEMTEFTKNQILVQAGTAMLAQANMAPQLVLALFG